jgi:D-alanine-D-alanine ligase
MTFTKMRGLRVAVLSGGRSSERDVSLVTAAAVSEGLVAAGHLPLMIDVDRDGVWRRGGEVVRVMPGDRLAGVDVVFPALHGPFGEDGTVQGLLECLDVPYVGAGVLASALCLDKPTFKALLGRAGVPQVAYRVVDEEQFRVDRTACLERLGQLGLPAFVKPARQGTSVGVTRAACPDDLGPALETALAYGPVAIVEAAASGLEIECAVIGNREPLVSQPGELLVFRSRSGWRDLPTKMTRGSIQLFVPARLPQTVRELIRALALRAFELTRCTGLARVDFFVDGNQVLVNEVNTMPGLGPTSIFALTLAEGGISHPQLLDRLVSLALERHATRPLAPALTASTSA